MKFEDITKGDEYSDVEIEQLKNKDDVLVLSSLGTIHIIKNHNVWELIYTKDGLYMAINKYVESFWALGEKK